MASKKYDPIREKYYKPLEYAETAASTLFYVSAILSIVTLLVDQTDTPKLYLFAHTAFVLVVISMWIVGVAIRLRFFPRAHQKRYQDFLSHAFGVPLGHEQTTGYYTAPQSEPIRGIAVQLLENSLYSKDTATEMAKRERIKAAVYISIWLIVLLSQHVDIALTAVVAQVLFGEQLLSKWWRLEWLSRRFESVHEEVFRLFQSKPTPDRFHVLVMDLLAQYETAKANGGVTLSSRVFTQRAARIDAEWVQIRTILGL